MQPPKTINVIDKHGGFTALTPQGRRRSDGYQSTNTLWRPGALLSRGTSGMLISFREDRFYQNNNDVTEALYKVPGYRYPAVVWFDNPTGRRIDGVSFISPADVEPWRRGGGKRRKAPVSPATGRKRAGKATPRPARESATAARLRAKAERIKRLGRGL